MRVSLLTLAVAGLSRVHGFAPVTTTTTTTTVPTRWPPQLKPQSTATVALHAENNNNNNNSPNLPKLPIGSIVLGVLGLQCFQDLMLEVPNLFGEKPDPFGTFFDFAFFLYAAKSLLDQTGASRSSLVSGGGRNPAASLSGVRCGITLSVGREPGTWMDKDWAASGARLMLPLTLQFTDEDMDLGIPGEQALGGRFCQRVTCEGGGGSFVGPKGTVDVPVEGGGWTTSRTSRRGESRIRFFLDFPEGASRNDVDIPKGRVFFSSACFDDGSKDDSGKQEIDIPASELLEMPSGLQMVKSGGLTIKRPGGIMNLYGALGDINLILGRYSVSQPREASGV